MRTSIYYIFIINLLLTAFLCVYGKDVNIAVIDTGIDPNHPQISGRLWVNDKPATRKNYGVDFSSLNGQINHQPIDKHGHGTHIAGIIAKVNPNAKLHILKYYNPNADGYQNLKATIRALKYAINIGVDIINYSSGGPEKSPEEQQLFELAKKKGILIISAAGNEFRNIDSPNGEGFYPASYSYENIITVGALDKSMNKVSSSNWGKKSVDIFAPGKKIKSSFPNYQIAEMTGTSQATAFVSAAVSLILEKKKFHSNYEKFLSTKNLLFQTGYQTSQLREICLSSKALNIKALRRKLSQGTSIKTASK